MAKNKTAKPAKRAKPANGTRWVYISSTRSCYDVAMRDGKLMKEYRDERKTERAEATVAELRRWTNSYTEIPPDGPPAHSAG